ncbi:MAG: toll/interleukin-1 receptor domain-containing protein [Thiogranum sp.]|nr:toll/interleukin-1 receptor domain-containing protein [Thiogranum sp.]
MSPPKVFLSHASEDKERFVTSFAERLRNQGIDAWLDKWEMLPGDSLVDKLFEEGIKNADAVIIVLSTYSIQKRWVGEELNASFVARVSKGTKIIPIVLDTCEVPQALKSTLWESILDTDNYDESFDRIVASIFGKSIKPAIGDPPKYSQISTNPVSGLNRIDNVILKMSCEYLIEKDDYVIEPGELFGRNVDLDIPKQEIMDSIEILESEGYLEVSRYIGGGEDKWGCHYQVSLLGFEEYCKAYIEEYDQVIERIAGLIVNEELHTNYELAESVDRPLQIVNHVIRLLENNDYLKTGDELSERICIYNVSAKLRRALE